MSGGKCPDIPRQLPSDKFVRTWTIPLQVRKLETYKFDFAQLIKTGEIECSAVPKTKAVCAYHVYVQYIPRYNVYMLTTHECYGPVEKTQNCGGVVWRNFPGVYLEEMSYSQQNYI